MFPERFFVLQNRPGDMRNNLMKRFKHKSVSCKPTLMMNSLGVLRIYIAEKLAGVLECWRTGN